MTGVFIPNEELPQNCYECFLKMNCDDCEGWECVCVPSHHQIGYLDELLSDKRRDDCPLVELPPHGRLIDADALRDECSTDNKPKEDWEYPWYEAQSMIDNAPTIIPADGGET